MKNKINIEIIKDVYWEDYGTMRKVFRKGWIGWVDCRYEDDKLVYVGGESPIYKGVSDEIWEDCYKIIQENSK